MGELSIVWRVSHWRSRSGWARPSLVLVLILVIVLEIIAVIPLFGWRSRTGRIAWSLGCFFRWRVRGRVRKGSFLLVIFGRSGRVRRAISCMGSRIILLLRWGSLGG